MDGMLYPASLVLLAVLAFTFNQNNNTKLALLMIVIGIYVVYSHETGDSATNWKNDMVESVDKSVGNYNSKHGIESLDTKKVEDEVK